MQTWQVSRKKRPSPHLSRSVPITTADCCLRIVDFGIAAIILFAPMIFGGRHLVGRFVFVALSCVVGVAWLTRQAILAERRGAPTVAHIFITLAIAIVALQLVPLPPEWVDWIAPRTQSLLPLWTSSVEDGGVTFGNWKLLSLTPHRTQLALATLISYYLLFLTAIQRIQTLDDIQRIVRLVAISAVGMSLFGLAQYLTSNGRFFWFYEYPFSTTNFPVKGSFTCRNHFANFLALGIGPVLGCILLAKPREPSRNRSTSSIQRTQMLTTRYAFCIGLVVLVVAVLMTLSRGGAIASGTAAIVAIGFFVKRREMTGASLYGLAFMGLIVVSLLSLGNYDKISSRLDDLTAGSVEELDNRDARRRIWNANLSSIRVGGLLGSGAGSHRDIHPAYLNESFRKEYTHAENSYLQIVTENGWAGLGILIALVLCLMSWSYKSIRASYGSSQRTVLTGAIVASLIASLVHAVVDFIWFVPACFTLALLMAACVLRLSQLGTRSTHTELPSKPSAGVRSRAVAFAAAASLAGYFAIATTLPAARASLHWDKYLLTTIDSQTLGQQELKGQASSNEHSAMQDMFNESMMFQLQETIACCPQFPRAHLRLASRYLQLFESTQLKSDNPMPIEQIREAATNQFQSAEELKAWLNRAVGENSLNLYRAYYHARKALELSPLQAEAYLYLAKLAFLEGRDQRAVDAYVQQGVTLRPQSGKVLLEAGWQYLQIGEVDRGLEYWQRVYQQPEPRRLQIVQRLGGLIPAVHFAKLFQPDWHTLRYVWKRYRELGNESDWQFLLGYGETAALEEEAEHSTFGAARIWLSLSKMQQEVSLLNESIRSLSRAYRLAPDDYSVRRAIGRTLLNTGQREEAQAHLRWCLARKPDDPRLRSELVKASQSEYLPQTVQDTANSRLLK